MHPDELVRTAVTSPEFVRAVFAGPARKPCPWLRVVARPVVVRDIAHVQFEFFDAKQSTTKNVPPAELAAPLADLAAFAFAGVHVTTTAEEIDVRTTTKLRTTVGRRKLATAPAAAGHNRTKDVPLPEGRADRVLEIMGVTGPDGRVKPTMRAKFTQINEFLKQLTHALADAGLRGLGRPVEILDCGCGSSYLTLAAHHYLNDILGVPANLLGIDVNDDVVRKSSLRAAKLGDSAPQFACGPIAGGDSPADVVFALHACDTATDDALARAVRGGAKLVLSVPCCHKHLNRQLEPVAPFGPVLRHGILRERAADILTDTFRALAMRVMGYRADVVEFVSPDHTPKNLMIRAVKVGPPGDAAAAAEYRELRAFWRATPYAETAFGDAFRRFVE